MSRTKSPTNKNFQAELGIVKAVILAIDPGRRSGWAILSPEGVVESGHATKTLSAQWVTQQAQRHAKELGLSLVIVGESWKGGGGPHGNHQRTMTGLGAAWGRWETVIELAGHPRRRVVRIDTGTWRQLAYGKSRIRKEDAKQMAVLYARAAGVEPASHDEAEAVMIGIAAQRYQRVHDVALKRRK